MNNAFPNKINKELNNAKNNFESFVVEFRDSREDVMNIVKIIIEQNKIEPFIKFIQNKILKIITK
jgi:hypothetical protein